MRLNSRLSLKNLVVVTAGGALLFIAGCKDNPPGKGNLPGTIAGGESSGAAVAEVRTSGKFTTEIELVPVKYAQLQKAIQAQRGRVVVLDLWAEY